MTVLSSTETITWKRGRGGGCQRPSGRAVLRLKCWRWSIQSNNRISPVKINKGDIPLWLTVGVVMFVCEGVREDGRVEWGEGLNVALDLVPHPFNLT